MAKSFFDKLGDNKLAELAKAAADKAIKETHEAGLPVTGKVNGVLSRVYPDGRVEPLTAVPSVENKTLSSTRT